MPSVIEEEYSVVESYKGSELEGREYEPLFDFKKLDKKAYFVTCDNYVTLTDGTGIVHIAPAFGEDDARIGRKYDLPFLQLVDGKGEMTAETPWAGMFCKDCLLYTSSSILKSNYEIGDTLTLSPENKDAQDKVCIQELTIVGTVKSATYFSIEHERSTVGNGTVELILYTPAGSFAYDVYTDLFLTVSGAKTLNCFLDEYTDTVTPVKERIETLAESREQARYDEIMTEAEGKIAEAQLELDDKKKEADDELAKARCV